MSVTTTIRLPDELKARIASAAERAGKTTHSFIIDTFTEKAEMDEQRVGFDLEADTRFSQIVAPGRTVGASGKRELVTGRKGRGFVALYQYIDVIDTVFILAVRSQREAGYEH